MRTFTNYICPHKNVKVVKSTNDEDDFFSLFECLSCGRPLKKITTYRIDRKRDRQRMTQARRRVST